MKKSKFKNNDDLDFFEILTIILNKKLKIFFITFLISFISISYYLLDINKKINSNNVQLFEFSLKVSPGNNPLFFQFISTINAISEKKNSQSILIQPKGLLSIESVFERFIRDLMDYDEIVTILSDNQNLNKNIAGLNEKEKMRVLYKYAELLKIKKNSSNIESEHSTYLINFKWHDKDQGVEILNNTLELVIKNLEKSIYRELDDYLEIVKFLSTNQELNKINFLLSQRQIAKELNIQKNELSSSAMNIYNNSMDYSLIPYYLIGYEAIDKEIDALKNLKNRQVDYIENLYKKVIIQNQNQWVDYNMLTISIDNLKNNSIKQKNISTTIITIILFSLIVSIFYVLISNEIENRKSFINK